MANKNPSPATRIKKGEVRNRSGRPPERPELKLLKNLSQQELIEIGNLVVKGDVVALRKIAKDESNTALKMMLAAVVVKIISKGDMHALDILLNRLVGKVKDQVNVTHEQKGKVIIHTFENGSEAEKK